MPKNPLRFTVLFLMGTMLVGTPSLLRAQGLGAESVGNGRMAGMQRVVGEVTAIAGPKLTVKGEDGAVFTVVATDNTRVTRGRGNMIKIDEVEVGDGVLAAGRFDDATKTLHAVIIAAQDAAAMKKARENLGKTYIAGKVTAIDIDNLKLTVKRPDGTSQTIGFDESTSFRRGRAGRGGMAGGETPAPAADTESVTLADIKVGDNVSGPGSLKNGIFVPKTLSVATPGQARHRHQEPVTPTATAPSNK